MTKNLYIVTSAINISPDTANERFLQTLHTIDSIRSKDESCEIILADSSPTTIPSMFIDLLKDVTIFDFSEDLIIHEIIKDAEKIKFPVSKDTLHFYKLGYVKNRTEIYVINMVLREIAPDKYKRIFKISGRYFFNYKFDINLRNVKSKINLSVEKDSPFNIYETDFIGSKKYRSCVTWDYCTTIHDEMLGFFLEIEKYIVNQANNQKLADIEHGLARCIPLEKINSIDVLGVMGRVNNDRGTIYSE